MASRKSWQTLLIIGLVCGLTGVVRAHRRQLSEDRGGSVEAARLHRSRALGRACGDPVGGGLRRADM